MSESENIINGMSYWFKDRQAASAKERTPEQRAWDSAIMAAAEYLRRRLNYEEKLSLELCELASTRLPKDQPKS